MIAVLRVPMAVVLEVVMVFMATRLVAASRKVDVQVIAFMGAVAVIGQESASSSRLGLTTLGGARCVPVGTAEIDRPSTATRMSWQQRAKRVRLAGDECERWQAVSQPELGEGLGRVAGRPLDPAGRGARRRLVGQVCAREDSGERQVQSTARDRLWGHDSLRQ